MKRPVVGLLGCGDWGRNLLRDLLVAGADTVVVDPDPARRENAIAAGARSAHAELDELHFALDGAVVATPTATHAELTRQALSRARFVYVEKPMTTEARVARELVGEAGERLFCLEKWRYHPGIVALAGLLSEGSLGELKQVRTWRMSEGLRTSGTDPVWELLPHDLSIVRHLLGPLPEVVSAQAEYANGQRVGVVAELGVRRRVRLEVSVAAAARRRRVEVDGEHSRAVFDLDEPRRLRLRRRGREESLVIPGELPTRIQMDAVVNHLMAGALPHSTAAEGLETVERIEQILACAGKSTSELLG